MVVAGLIREAASGYDIFANTACYDNHNLLQICSARYETIKLDLIFDMIFSYLFFSRQVMVYSLKNYEENILIPSLNAAIGEENVKALRVPLSMETADLAQG